MSECGDNVASQGEVSKLQAEAILQRIKNMAQARMALGQGAKQAVDEVTGLLKNHDEAMSAATARNVLLTAQARQGIKNYVSRFKDIGTGIMAFLEGRQRDVQGARNSIDYQIKANNAQYFGRLVAELEGAGVLRQFRDNSITRDIYHEIGELNKPDGKPGISGNGDAQKIAQIVDNVTQEMIARQNRAGAYIHDLPGYTVRQSHDMQSIRAEGRMPDGTLSKNASYQAWRDFTLPLINKESTFLGADPEKWMRTMHDDIYNGFKGGPTVEWTAGGWGVRGDLARRASDADLLHFKDADSAWQYNQKYGIKDFRQQVISDIHSRARSIGLMENLGPSPEENLWATVRELKNEAKAREDSDKQIASINDAKISASLNQLTGVNNIPANPTLAKIGANVRVLSQLAKMGSVLLTNLFSDRAFLQAEMAYQGISHLTTLGKQVTSLARRSPEQTQMLRLMGVGMDSLMGNALARYGDVGSMSGVIDAAQKKFFDINFHNFWTDNTKSSAAELMAAHLGELSDRPWDKMPPETARVLKLYDIMANEWDQIRGTAQTVNGQKYITPNGLREALGTTLSPRDMDRLETQLRTYIADRVDMAVPTPGAAERRIATGDTRVGTPLGEAIRTLMLFKSFPLAVMNKVLSREIYGRGATSMGDWLMNDHQGKFNMATFIAMATGAGYMSLVMHDAVAGKTPRELVNEDGSINYETLNESAIRGGALGLMGDFMLREYNDHTSTFLEAAGGPVIGQADQFAKAAAEGVRGEFHAPQLGRMVRDNTPFINLFYVRPILNYYVLWNLETMMDPGRVRRMEVNAEKQHQHYFMGPAAQ